jgi:hypothetical protein
VVSGCDCYFFIQPDFIDIVSTIPTNSIGENTPTSDKQAKSHKHTLQSSTVVDLLGSMSLEAFQCSSQAHALFAQHCFDSQVDTLSPKFVHSSSPVNVGNEEVHTIDIDIFAVPLPLSLRTPATTASPSTTTKRQKVSGSPIPQPHAFGFVHHFPSTRELKDIMSSTQRTRTVVHLHYLQKLLKNILSKRFSFKQNIDTMERWRDLHLLDYVRGMLSDSAMSELCTVLGGPTDSNQRSSELFSDSTRLELEMLLQSCEEGESDDE